MHGTFISDVHGAMCDNTRAADAWDTCIMCWLPQRVGIMCGSVVHTVGC
jgi:hypothetical protein